MDNLRKEFFRNDGRHGLRRRRRVAALDGVTFEVGRGETVAILGQNGSGKSTLIRLLSTLLLHDGGAARIFGHDAFTETRAVRRLINRVSVEASFFKKMSAVENLSYAARFYGMPIRETRKRIPEILERVGFPKARMNEPLEDLSRGMQQKVALARALLCTHRPAPRRADDRPRPAVEARGAGVHPRDQARARRVVLLCTRPRRSGGARRPRRHPRSRTADRAGAADELKRKHGAKTLEEAFFAATGKSFEDEPPEEDE